MVEFVETMAQFSINTALGLSMMVCLVGINFEYRMIKRELGGGDDE